MLTLLQKLTAVTAPSGQEAPLRELIVSFLPNGYRASTDRAGNLLITPPEGCTDILLATPMDEIACLTGKAQEDGMISLTPTASFDPRILPGRAVCAGGLNGVIGTKAVHMQSKEERAQSVPIEKLYLDIGATDKAEAERLLPSGTAVTFRGETRLIGKSRVMGRVLDARLGIAVLLTLLREAPRRVSFFFAAGNLTDGQGATAYAALCPAKTVLAVEAREADEHCKLGGGAILPVMDKNTVYPPALFQKAADGVQYGAPKKAPLAAAFQRGGGGREVLTVGIPCRYPRTPLPVADPNDCASAAELLRRLTGLL